MSIESKLSEHWTDDQLIAYLYGVGPAGEHVEKCMECRTRLAGMEAQREISERNSMAADEPSFDFLAAQRRQIYARLTEPVRWWSAVHVRRWASAIAAVVVLSGGMLYYEQQKQAEVGDPVSDAQLAQDVSNMSQNPEAQPTAPLQALFE